MKKTDLEDVIYRIGSDGFDYCFRDYSDFEEVKDKKFHELRVAYEKSAQKLEGYLKKECARLNLEYEELMG